ncbi:MAG: ABC transporter permease [Mesorhizobium sp.]
MHDASIEQSDRVLLKRQMAAALRRQKVRAFMLVAPLLFFILATFVYPITGMLVQSAYTPEFAAEMPRTARALAGWNEPEHLPPEAVWEALVLDLQESQQRGAAGKIAAAMNIELPGTRSLVMKTARKAGRLAPPYRQALVSTDDGWENAEVWSTMKRLSDTVTARFYLAALDHRIDAQGRISAQPESRQIYIPLFLRTFLIGAVVTLCCLLLGFPVAYWLSILPMRYANLLMILVLLPFWTSLLVRTTAWIVLLQNQGVINSLLVWSGVISDGNRVQLIFNSTGTVIAMTHILLPFMILPLYSVMKTVPPSYMRAARSLGANQFTAFVRIYLPQTQAGVAAGCLLVFILSLGYYITPALVGGESGTLISNMIAYHVQKSLNWSLAAALSTLLLASVLLLYWAYNRLARADGLRLG